MTQEVLDRGLQVESIDLVIALDCGTNSIEESEFLSASGIDLIVIDHHQSKGPPLTNAIQVNPHLHDDHGESWRLLCTAGLAFKLIHGLFVLIGLHDVEVQLLRFFILVSSGHAFRLESLGLLES